MGQETSYIVALWYVIRNSLSALIFLSIHCMCVPLLLFYPFCICSLVHSFLSQFCSIIIQIYHNLEVLPVYFDSNSQSSIFLSGITCPHLEKLKNGAVSYSSVEVGSSATYSCDNGFIISGADTRICVPCGAWSPVPPTCLKCQ